MYEAPPNLESQVRLSKMLGLGFALSLCPLGGLGSLSALLIGVRALRMIGQSQGELAGRVMAWWCIAVGAAGFAVATPPVVWRVVGAFNQ